MSVEESCFDDLDRRFFSLSSAMADTFSWTYGMLGGRLIAPLDPDKFDNATSKAKEIGIRALIVLGAITSFLFAGTYILLTAVVLGAGSKLFRGAAFYFQKDGFTHIQGSSPEKSLEKGQATVMTWNIRGHGGGLHYAEGGVVHWRSRIDRITDSIKAENPDVIVLQEIHDTALINALVDRLGAQYAHFYTHLGADGWGSETGCMVITKCAVHSFSHTSFTETDQKVKRGFETIEIKANPADAFPCARIIGTQLSPGKAAGKMRMEQVSQIINKLASEKLAMPTLFVGSLGADRDSKEEGVFLSRYLYHSYLGDAPTHSDELVSQWAPIYEGQEGSSDFVSFFKRSPARDLRVFPVLEKGIRLLGSHLVRGFDENYNTKTALSDHHAIVTTFCGLKMVQASH
jgi:endonuclease/exonuclease/phosphatase family metal-dependent hydrolase